MILTAVMQFQPEKKDLGFSGRRKLPTDTDLFFEVSLNAAVANKFKNHATTLHPNHSLNIIFSFLKFITT